MKKFIALLMAMMMVLALGACGNEKAGDDIIAKSEGVMTYEEYAAAAMDTAVVVEFYVQATQSWWDNQIVVYGQDENGGYLAYNMACTEEDAAKLVPGTKIRVEGFKGEWAGEVEVMDGTFTFVEGGDTFVAEALDVTELLGTDELIAHQNEFVSFKGLTVAASKDAEGKDVAYLYKWDGSGSQGDDIYFNVAIGEQTYTFTVNAYLVGSGPQS